MAEMKAGYKQTDIGVISEDWDIKSYGEVFDFLSTISNSRADLCFKGDFGYIHYGDIHTRWENTLDLSKNELPELRRDKIKKLPASLRDGDLVMADASEDYEGIAKTVEVKNIREKKVFSGLHTFLMRDRNSVFSDGIRGYIHEMPVVRRQIQKVATGLKVFGVSKNTLKNDQIPVPKPEEQKKIAAALSDVDGLIESLEKLVAKKRDMKTAAMQQLLTGKKRLPVFGGEWEEKILKEIAPLQRGFDLPKSQIEKGNIPVAYSNGIMAYHNKAMVKGPGVYTGRSGTIGKVNYIASDYWPHNTSLWVTTFFDNDPKFIFYLYGFIGFDRFSSGSGVPTLNRNDAHDYRCFIPHSKEQVAISTILADMDIEIDALEQRLGKARSLKTGMMQELLTGKTRLIKTDRKQEEA